MKIVMVSGHACVRVQKQAIPMLEKGHSVHLVARKQPGFAHFYKTFLHYDDVGQCIESLKLHADADIFHCHNEPSWFVCAVKELYPNKPVILDVHDSYLTRSTPEEDDKAAKKGKPHMRIATEERNSFQLADGLVFVSEPVRDVVMSEFNLTQPHTVLPSYLPLGLYVYHTKEWLGGLVYEGRVTVPAEYNGRNGTGAWYCDYMEVAKKAQEMKMDFHVYSGRHDAPFRDLYKDIAYVYPGFGFKDLLMQISRHDWGLVGNLLDSPQWQQTLPNKLFEYIASGIPCVCINASASSKIVEEYGIGITVKSLEELGERWKEHTEIRKNIWKVRTKLGMENHIQRVLDLYESLL
jgi:glycosyltransferase involved in cell wall biosynthesis